MRARKRFGQHYLVDQHILEQMVAIIAPKSDDHLVEIGPGGGALTDYLIATPRQLDLIEIDRDLIALLQQRYAAYPQVHLHQADVLNFCLDSLRDSARGEKLRVVGNLPYNISTPLLISLLAHVNVIRDMHFLLQKEVAERLCAPVGNKHYGRLSVLTQFYCEPQLLFMVEPEAFNPPPKVRSAFVRLRLREQRDSLPSDLDDFFQLVKLAFAHRRKTIANNLKSVISAAMLSAIGIDPIRRPQELSVAEFSEISHHVDKTILQGS